MLTIVTKCTSILGGSTTVPVLRTRTCTKEHASGLLRDDRTDLVEAPGSRKRAARGAITGALFGAGLWSILLVLAGVIKL